ncbi:hypothetical protein T265_02704 [Opisthorchis viverrini]|uniref:Uncharacterized protein n=1 Tax=Opisthorchis viverrini TaxID=6198 RepID=A0A074ZV61_OPIVI|nr:hypothetical protein T265_02704 [Opisthorchis viverrini]KER31031.1 hypothetical protein T265_02704 [Opisthorchis viverrini]
MALLQRWEDFIVQELANGELATLTTLDPIAPPAPSEEDIDESNNENNPILETYKVELGELLAGKRDCVKILVEKFFVQLIAPNFRHRNPRLPGLPFTKHYVLSLRNSPVLRSRKKSIPLAISWYQELASPQMFVSLNERITYYRKDIGIVVLCYIKKARTLLAPFGY